MGIVKLKTAKVKQRALKRKKTASMRKTPFSLKTIKVKQRLAKKSKLSSVLRLYISSYNSYKVASPSISTNTNKNGYFGLKLKINNEIKNSKVPFLNQFSGLVNTDLQVIALTFYDKGCTSEVKEYLIKKYGALKCDLVEFLYNNQDFKYKGINYYQRQKIITYDLYDQKKDVIISIQKDFDYNSANYNLLNSLNDFAKFKNSNVFYPSLKKLVFTSKESPDEKHWKDVYSEPTFRVSADTGEDTITIYKNENNFIKNISHEIGHLVDKNFRYSTSNDYIDAVNKDYEYTVANSPDYSEHYEDGNWTVPKGITRYADEAMKSLDSHIYSEDFAETYSLISQAILEPVSFETGNIRLLSLDEFKDRYPNRYKYFRENLFDIF